MNRIWKLLVCTSLFMAMIFSSGLVNAELVEHGRELIAVLCTVDIDRRRTQHGHSLTIKLHCEVVRNLTTHRDNHTTRLLEIDHVEHSLQ